MLLNLTRILSGSDPVQALLGLERTGVLRRTLPELARLRDVSAGPDPHHQEGDALTHTLMVLQESLHLSERVDVRLGALLHDLGKGTTPVELLPRHHDHEERGFELVRALGGRLHLDPSLIEAAGFASLNHTNLHRYGELRPARRLQLIREALANPLGPEGLRLVAVADSLGRVSPHRGDVRGPDRFGQDARLVERIRNPEDQARAFRGAGGDE